MDCFVAEPVIGRAFARPYANPRNDVTGVSREYRSPDGAKRNPGSLSQRNGPGFRFAPSGLRLLGQRKCHARTIEQDGADFIHRAGIGLAQVARGGDSGFAIGAVHDVKAQ